MMTLMIAAAVAAQPAPPASPHGQMTPAQQQQHKDCCKDCCEHMAAKDDGHGAERGGEGAGHGDHAQ
jgi:hypothetical protein